MRDGLLLDRGVDDHALQVFGPDRLDSHGRVDGGLEQVLQTFFAQVAPKPADLRGVAWQPVFVVSHAAKELPQHVLAPARGHLFVAEIEAVLQVKQAGHQADRQLGTPGIADTRALQHLLGAEHILAFEDLTRARLAIELRRQRCFDLIPWQPSRQHRQGVAQVDHRVDASAEKVGRFHPRFPQKSIPQMNVLEGIGGRS